LARRRAALKRGRSEREVDDGLPPIELALQEMTRVFLNLFSNGFYATTKRQRDELFQPFVITKPTGEGTGLGLSISYDIVTQQHGGAFAMIDDGLGFQLVPWHPVQSAVRLRHIQHGHPQIREDVPRHAIERQKPRQCSR
jgi:signal transduction histidine kinase